MLLFLRWASLRRFYERMTTRGAKRKGSVVWAATNFPGKSARKGWAALSTSSTVL